MSSAWLWKARRMLAGSRVSLDAGIERQNQQVAQLRKEAPDIDDCIGRLESNLSLSKEENEALVRRVGESIRGRKTPPTV